MANYRENQIVEQLRVELSEAQKKIDKLRQERRFYMLKKIRKVFGCALIPLIIAASIILYTTIGGTFYGVCDSSVPKSSRPHPKCGIGAVFWPAALPVSAGLWMSDRLTGEADRGE